jgi:hypothetical protein
LTADVPNEISPDQLVAREPASVTSMELAIGVPEPKAYLWVRSTLPASPSTRPAWLLARPAPVPASRMAVVQVPPRLPKP